MAVPTNVTLLNAGGLTDGVIDNADANTNWTTLTTLDSDVKVQGTNAVSGVMRSDGDDAYVDVGGAPVTAVGKVLRGWINTANLPYMGTEASDPYKLWCYDSSVQSNGIALFGSDTYPGGWFYFWQDMDDFTTVTLANVDRWGVEAGHTSNAKNATNTWMDVLRYCDGYSFTGGTSGDKVELADIYTYDSGNTYAYGILQEFAGAYFCTGEIQIGSGATTTYFEMDGEVLIYRDTPGALTISAGLYTLSAVGTGCDCLIKNSVIRAEGSDSTVRPVLDFSSTDATIEFTDNLVVRTSTITFASGQTATGNTYDDCGQITHAGSDMSDSVVKNYEGTADTAAVVYNINADPSGEMDNMSFTKGTAATHAIEFGSNTPSSVTLNGWAVSGYNASDGQTDSVIYNNTGGALTVNVLDGSGLFTYKNGTSATTTIVQGVETEVVVKDVDTQLAVSGASVLLRAADGTNFPYQDTVTITGTGTTATVTHTTHGLATGDFVYIYGANEDEYNGVFEITYSDASTYTYTTTSTVTSSPATGTIKATFCFIKETTGATGIVSDVRVLPSGDQPVEGHVRKGTTSPFYKESLISDTVSSTSGKSISVLLISDE